MSDQYTREEILAKIAKIMRHAESARAINSKAEAAAFERKACALLDQYNLSMSDVEFEAHCSRNAIGKTAVLPSQWGGTLKLRRDRHVEDIFGLLADQYGGHICVVKGLNSFLVVGREVVREMIIGVGCALVEAQNRLCDEAYALYKSQCVAEYKPVDRKFRKWWKQGFFAGIGLQIKKSDSLKRTETALVRVRSEAEEARDWARAELKTKREKEPGINCADANGEAFSNGMMAGMNHEFGDTGATGIEG